MSKNPKYRKRNEKIRRIYKELKAETINGKQLYTHAAILEKINEMDIALCLSTVTIEDIVYGKL